MKIFFIYPNHGSQVGFNYGVSHMAGVLKDAGHKVAFWQLCEDLAPLPTRAEFLARIQEEEPDLIAFSVVTNQWHYARTLASWIKAASSIPIACGGVHTLVAAREILDTRCFDYVFRGECEDAFLEFVERIDRNESVDDVRNLAFARCGDVIINPVRHFPNLEALPFKDYEIMDFQRLIDAKNGWVGLMASRGCPFSCSYCFNHKMVAAYREDLKCRVSELGYIRRFSIGRLIEEINYLLKNYQRIRMFIFDDDLFTFDKEYVKGFCKAYKETCDIPFVVNAHVNFFDEECAHDLARANCRIVKFGVESGSPEIRRTILNRHMSNRKITHAIRTVEEAGMHSSVFIIIGFPHETSENLFETIKLLGESRPGRFRWTYFFPFPGTKSHEISLEGGYINVEKMEELKNFTDQSCLEFGEEHNLLLEKIGRVMPWFVNAYSRLPVADFYMARVEQILKMDREAWNRASPALHREDSRISADFSERGLSHYAIKYNPFMGVISDYFLKD